MVENCELVMICKLLSRTAVQKNRDVLGWRDVGATLVVAWWQVGDMGKNDQLLTEGASRPVTWNTESTILFTKLSVLFELLCRTYFYFYFSFNLLHVFLMTTQSRFSLFLAEVWCWSGRTSHGQPGGCLFPFLLCFFPW